MGSSSEGDIIECPICLEKIEPGQGEAIFTAECSHSFHFTCISNNIEHENYNCPICRARWNNLPRVHRIQSPNNNNNRTVLEGFFQNPIHITYTPNPLTRRFDSSQDLTFSLPPSSSSPTNVSISASPERSAVSSALSRPRFSVLVEIKAPSSPSTSIRAPIDLVLVLDTSRSMEGDKLRLLKRAVTFVIDNLGPTDRVSIVSFSTRAHIIFPLGRASDQGVREFVKGKVDGLRARGKTNIVEGLKKGVEAITARRDTSVSSIMLLCDGIDTCHSHYSSSDYTSGPNSYLHLLPSSIRRSSDTDTDTETTLIPVHAFGLGSDHDPLAMGSIAHESGGTFSFVESHESIRDAFAGCMGGLLSVAARDLRLVLRSASPGVAIRSIESSHEHIGTISDDRSEGVIDIGVFCADGEKALFLIDLSVPKPANAYETRTDLLSIKCSYLGSVSSGTETVEAGTVWINRPVIPSFDENAVNPRVDRERTRLRSISEAQVGDFGGGARTLLWGRGVRIVDSDSWRRGDDDASHSLEAEIREMDHRMTSFSVTFGRGGRGMSSRRLQPATARGRGPRSGRGHGGSVL